MIQGENNKNMLENIKVMYNKEKDKIEFIRIGSTGKILESRDADEDDMVTNAVRDYMIAQIEKSSEDIMPTEYGYMWNRNDNKTVKLMLSIEDSNSAKNEVGI